MLWNRVANTLHIAKLKNTYICISQKTNECENCCNKCQRTLNHFSTSSRGAGQPKKTIMWSLPTKTVRILLKFKKKWSRCLNLLLQLSVLCSRCRLPRRHLVENFRLDCSHFLQLQLPLYLMLALVRIVGVCWHQFAEAAAHLCAPPLCSRVLTKIRVELIFSDLRWFIFRPSCGKSCWKYLVVEKELWKKLNKWHQDRGCSMYIWRYCSREGLKAKRWPTFEWWYNGKTR